MQESAHLQQEFVGDMIALLADVGGTKTQLALMNQAGELIAESLVVNADHHARAHRQEAQERAPHVAKV